MGVSRLEWLRNVLLPSSLARKNKLHVFAGDLDTPVEAILVPT